MARVEWPGLPKLVRQLQAMKDLDCTPAMEKVRAIMVEQNRVGVLSGLDGYDQPMPPLKYRNGAGAKTKRRLVPLFGKSRYAAVGGVNGNLAAAEYKQLTGPRLAPRGDQSRVIKNLQTEIQNPSDGTWQVVGAWADVVSDRGVPFLPFHFEGAGRNPKYDLRPIRPWALKMCYNAIAAFAKAVFFDKV